MRRLWFKWEARCHVDRLWHRCRQGQVGCSSPDVPAQHLSPGHYAGRWATMPSADFCLITVKIAPRRAAVCHPVRSLLADDMPERPDLFYTRACTGSRRPLVKQISPNKNMNCHCTTPSFTVSREPLDFVTLCPLIPETQPCMTFLSVGSQLCASASFPPALAGWQLPSASSYAALEARTVGSPTGDLHPMSSCPCRAYTQRSSGASLSLSPLNFAFCT